MSVKSLKTAALASLFASTFALAGPVNINKADSKTIAKELDGIGQKRAEAIVAYRKEHGGFKSAQELMKVKGVGKSTFESNKGDIRIK